VTQSQSLPESWDEEVDLVVVGSGGGALTAAVVTAVEGLEVIVLEKTELIGGTTAISGGGLWVPCNRHTEEVGVTDSREEALEYVRACSGGDADDEVLQAMIDNGPKMVEFLEDRAGLGFRPWPSVGGTTDYRPWLPGAKHGGRTLTSPKFELASLGEWRSKLRFTPFAAWTIDPLYYYSEKLHLATPSADVPRRGADTLEGIEHLASGGALAGQLLRACLEQGVTLFTETPAKELLVENGRVVGVRAERDGAPFFVRARRGVVLGTGGFGQDEELKKLWLKRPLEFTCEIEENTGDGQKMGIGVGAQVSGLGDAWWMPQVAGGQLEDGTTVFIGSRAEDRAVPHTLIVNRRARRFMNEAINYYDAGEGFGDKTGGHSVRNLPAWLIFDSQAREKYNIVAVKFPGNEVPPWMHSSDTIEGLAESIGLDPAALRDAVDRFNGYARSGVDEEFDRGGNLWDTNWGDPNHEPNPCLGVLEKPPFYALEYRSGALATCGGLRVNAAAQVMGALTNEPIPGLYAVGNCSTGFTPNAYPGPGATIGAGMTFGYVVAQRVASGVDAPVEVGS
jgi:3-oxosteroid 1-dehydrogenase